MDLNMATNSCVQLCHCLRISRYTVFNESPFFLSLPLHSGFQVFYSKSGISRRKNKVMSTLEQLDIKKITIHVNSVILHWFNINGTHFHHHYPQSPPVNEQK